MIQTFKCKTLDGRDSSFTREDHGSDKYPAYDALGNRYEAFTSEFVHGTRRIFVHVDKALWHHVDPEMRDAFRACEEGAELEFLGIDLKTIRWDEPGLSPSIPTTGLDVSDWRRINSIPVRNPLLGLPSQEFETSVVAPGSIDEKVWRQINDSSFYSPLLSGIIHGFDLSTPSGKAAADYMGVGPGLSDMPGVAFHNELRVDGGVMIYGLDPAKPGSDKSVASCYDEAPRDHAADVWGAVAAMARPPMATPVPRPSLSEAFPAGSITFVKAPFAYAGQIPAPKTEPVNVNYLQPADLMTWEQLREEVNRLSLALVAEQKMTDILQRRLDVVPELKLTSEPLDNQSVVRSAVDWPSKVAKVPPAEPASDWAPSFGKHRQPGIES